MAFLASKRVRYVVISSKVYDRVFAAAADYPQLVDFYRQLEKTGTLVKEFRPGPGERGPVLRSTSCRRRHALAPAARRAAAGARTPAARRRTAAAAQRYPATSSAASSTSPSAWACGPA